MYYRYSTALSHLVLIIISVYCLKNYNSNKRHYFPVISYVIVLINSASGVWKWGNPANGKTSNFIYNHSRLLQTLFTLPCIVAQLWIKHDWDYAYTHLVCSFILWMCYYCKKYKEELGDLVIALNIASCFVVSFSSENWYGVTMGISYSINHFIFREGCEILELPTIDFHNYALCFFLPFSLKALQNV